METTPQPASMCTITSHVMEDLCGAGHTILQHILRLLEHQELGAPEPIGSIINESDTIIKPVLSVTMRVKRAFSFGEVKL